MSPYQGRAALVRLSQLVSLINSRLKTFFALPVLAEFVIHLAAWVLKMASSSARGDGDASVPRRKHVFADISDSSRDYDEELLLNSCSDWSLDLELSSDDGAASDNDYFVTSQKWTKLDNEKLPPPSPRFPLPASPGMTATVEDDQNLFSFSKCFLMMT